MKTNTISLVISYYIFGGIEGVEAFASNDDAVKAFIKKVSAVAVPRGSELITTLEGAYEWLGENEESLEISYSLQTSDVVVNDEQRDLIALADSLEKAVAADIYYYAADHDDQDACDQITEAKNAMLESAKVLRAYAHDSADNHASDEITTVVKLKNGILDEAKSFVSHKDAEAFFLLEVAKFEPSISDEDIEACLDNGYWDNKSGDDIFITQNDLIHKITPACDGFFFKHEVYTLDDCPFFNIEDAKELIGERVNVLENSETSEFNGLVIDASYTDIDGILITVLDQEDNAWDIHPRHIVRVEADDENNTVAQSGQTHQCCDNCGTHESQYVMSQCPKCGYIGPKATLSSVSPKEGMQVCVGGYDNNASAGQQRFVDEHFGQLFEVLEVGEFSSKLKNVPFRVKHAHVYEIVKRGEGK